MSARVLRALLLFALCAAAQMPEEFRHWKAPAGEERLHAAMSCSELRSLTGYDFSVLTTRVTPARADMPEFCRVIGQVQPEVRFEVALPASWNKRLVMIGNGGFAGESLDSPGRLRFRDEALRSGFVFTQTNTGHDAEQEPLASFAVNPQKVVDYAFRAVHVTAETAKAIARAYYETAPARSYFQGCSTGGRQALMSAQRFPQDFDGIVAGAPVLDFTGTMMKFAQRSQALASTPLPVTKMKALAEAIYARCDETDGLKDGLIDDPRRCGFDPAQHLPKCSGAGTAQCFTEAEIRSLQAVYAPVPVNGNERFPAWPVSAEITGKPARLPDGTTVARHGWENWIVRDDGPTLGVLFSESFFRYFLPGKSDPGRKLEDVQLEREAPRLAFIEQVLNATDPDLSAFHRRGGKLLMYFGWAEPSLNPITGIRYYESVRQTVPAADEFFRLYMLPGVFHCAGGPGPDTFPRLAAVIDWAERGIAPGALVAARIDDGKVTRTRPLCPYPQVAAYKGSGSIDDAANFNCKDAGTTTQSAR